MTAITVKQQNRILQFDIDDHNEDFLALEKRQTELREAMIFINDSRLHDNSSFFGTVSPETNRKILERIRALYK